MLDEHSPAIKAVLETCDNLNRRADHIADPNNGYGPDGKIAALAYRDATDLIQRAINDHQ